MSSLGLGSLVEVGPGGARGRLWWRGAAGRSVDAGGGGRLVNACAWPGRRAEAERPRSTGWPAQQESRGWRLAEEARLTCHVTAEERLGKATGLRGDRPTLHRDLPLGSRYRYMRASYLRDPQARRGYSRPAQAIRPLPRRPMRPAGQRIDASRRAIALLRYRYRYSPAPTSLFSPSRLALAASLAASSSLSCSLPVQLALPVASSPSRRKGRQHAVCPPCPERPLGRRVAAAAAAGPGRGPPHEHQGRGRVNGPAPHPRRLPAQHHQDDETQAAEPARGPRLRPPVHRCASPPPRARRPARLVG